MAFDASQKVLSKGDVMAGGKTSYLRSKIQDLIYGGTAFAALANQYLMLLTDNNTQAQRDAGVVTEVTGGSYIRKLITNNATNFGAASGTNGLKSLAVAQTFVTPTLDWGTVTGFAWNDSASAGNILEHASLTINPFVFSVLAATEVFTATGSAYADGTKVKLFPGRNLTFPAGATENSTYFVVNASGATFQLSTTLGGSAINITANGGGIIETDASQFVQANNNVTIGVGGFISTIGGG